MPSMKGQQLIDYLKSNFYKFIGYISVKFGLYNLKIFLNKGEIIYSHSYGFRFLSMVKKLWFRFANDNAMNNQEIIDWAIKDQAKYVIITSGGDYDYISFETKKNVQNS